MFQWTGTTRTRVAPAAAFAYLADPRHAGDWFASVTVSAPAPGPLHQGQTWRFAGAGKRGEQTIRLALYDPPRHFVWETATPRWGTSLVWELALTSSAPTGTTMALTTRWRVRPLGWPQAAFAAIVGRRTLPSRCQHTVERARDAIEAAFPAPHASQLSGGGPPARQGPHGRSRIPVRHHPRA
jgi:hypothetical protein